MGKNNKHHQYILHRALTNYNPSHCNSLRGSWSELLATLTGALQLLPRQTHGPSLPARLVQLWAEESSDHERFGFEIELIKLLSFGTTS